LQGKASFLFLYRDPRPVSGTLSYTSKRIKKCGFAAIGVPRKRYG